MQVAFCKTLQGQREDFKSTSCIMPASESLVLPNNHRAKGKPRVGKGAKEIKISELSD